MKVFHPQTILLALRGYPNSLQELVDVRLLRGVPVDPLTERDDAWVLEQDTRSKGVINLRSGAEGVGSDGKPYANW